MEEFVVYVLYSEKFGKTYTGFTNNLIFRFNSHNHFSRKGYTTRFRPWKVILVEFYYSKQFAMEREKELKSGNGREWIKKHILKMSEMDIISPQDFYK